MTSKSIAQNPDGQHPGKRKSTFNRQLRPSKSAKRASNRAVQQEERYDEEVNEEVDEESDKFSLDILSRGEYAFVTNPSSQQFGFANSETRLPNGDVYKHELDVGDPRPLYNKADIFSMTPAGSPFKDPLPAHTVKDEKALDDSLAIPVLGETLEHENQTMSLRSSQRRPLVVKAEGNDDIDMNREYIVKKEETLERKNRMTVWDHFGFKQEVGSKGVKGAVNEAQVDVIKEEAELIEENLTKLRRLQEENLQIRLELENVRLRTELRVAKVEFEHVKMREGSMCVVM